ncbi:type VII secretion integral membrane protein EccD [Micromonospora echinofusca]|uniref:Type VII secretion integral membrane protein EccD n=1 Tax=Micromonospora echinofusca TaxID=47858 RepID=A0ABS3VWV7_MICEH|nr:type VII secretion integral membrane protein EccD [Micromonospora echinofusca]MBO4209027.1 type VII secretion integral membrane protein EccD [Micromonospora echinofusca]
MSDLSRVVLVTPQRTVEMALPSMVPLADLIPVLVQRATLPGGLDQQGRQRAFNGENDWVLQRLGSGPLDEDLTVAALQIRDGETLYLRPRDAELPPVHFDDLIDGIATGLRNRPDRWGDRLTRVLFLVVCAVTLLTCFAILLDDAVPRRGTLATGCAVALVCGAMMCSRALADGWAAGTLGVAAVPFAGLAGHTVPPVAAPDASQLLCAAVAASLAALLVMFAVGQYRAFFLAGWLASLALAGYALLVVCGLTGVQSAAVTVAAALLATAAAPSLAFRLALFRLPQLPTSSTDLAEDIDPHPGARLLSGAVVADTYLTWLLVAAGVICTAGIVVVATTRGTAPTWFVITALGVAALRSRGLSSGWQRAATLLPVLVGGSVLVVRLAGRETTTAAALSVIGLLALAVAALALSRNLPGRRLLPYWGRFADFSEYLIAVGMVLSLLAVFDAYQWARALAG